MEQEVPLRPVVWTVPFGRSTFIPAGCLHHPLGERDLIERWVREVAEAENGFTILMGDTQDAARSHYRQHVRGYRQDENSQEALDEWSKKDVRDLAKILEPIKKRIIGAIRGNHFWEYSDGTNSEQYLCQLLGIKYLGPMGVVRLDFRDNGGRVRDHMVLVAHHNGGTKGGRTSGGDVNAMMRMEGSFDADIYCVSHTHRCHFQKEPIMTLTTKGEPRVVERTKVFIRTGAFLKGFKPDNPNAHDPHFPQYAELSAYRPTHLGWVTMEIKQTQVGLKGKNGSSYSHEIRRDIRLST